LQYFTLATLKTPFGPKAAIGIENQYYLFADIQPKLNLTVKDILTNWSTSHSMLEHIAASISDGHYKDCPVFSEEIADFATPVLYPNKLMAVGANYTGHLKEMGLPIEKWQPMPFFFRPPTTTLVGPGKTVYIPNSTKKFDWECELAVIIGKRLRNADKQEAMNAVAGYAIGLDLSCRDLMKNDTAVPVDLVRGKAQDTMAPCGPYIVPVEFIPNPYTLRIQLYVNEQKMMDANTSEMIYQIDEQLSIISEYITIEPGDILFTGSPSGSAEVNGGRFLQPGDTIDAQIEDVGRMKVTICKDEK
jgi:2-keto-4-pentenoate hydratase/2-oxohepta-3-ene-1,7-dioic acid hydratase in catechol pathway